MSKIKAVESDKVHISTETQLLLSQCWVFTEFLQRHSEVFLVFAEFLLSLYWESLLIVCWVFTESLEPIFKYLLSLSLQSLFWVYAECLLSFCKDILTSEVFWVGICWVFTEFLLSLHWVFTGVFTEFLLSIYWVFT